MFELLVDFFEARALDADGNDEDTRVKNEQAIDQPDVCVIVEGVSGHQSRSVFVVQQLDVIYFYSCFPLTCTNGDVSWIDENLCLRMVFVNVVMLIMRSKEERAGLWQDVAGECEVFLPCYHSHFPSYGMQLTELGLDWTFQFPYRYAHEPKSNLFGKPH